MTDNLYCPLNINGVALVSSEKQNQTESQSFSDPAWPLLPWLLTSDPPKNPNLQGSWTQQVSYQHPNGPKSTVSQSPLTPFIELQDFRPWRPPILFSWYTACTWGFTSLLQQTLLHLIILDFKGTIGIYALKYKLYRSWELKYPTNLFIFSLNNHEQYSLTTYRCNL